MLERGNVDMNKSILAAAAVAVIAFSAPAEAARRHYQPTSMAGQITKFCGDRVCSSYAESIAQAYKAPRAGSRAHGHRSAASPTRRLAAEDRKTSQRPRQAETAEPVLIDKPQEYVKPSSPDEKLVTIQAYKRSVCKSNRGSTSLARVVEPLKSKAQEIVRACGAIIVSTDCRGGATPNHRNGEAVDIRMPGNKSPACIYAHLKGWPGGISTDYWTAPGVRHVHFSYSRKHEWGLRFSHGRHGKRVRYAARRQ